MAATHVLTVPRTARYVTLGPPQAGDVWFVLHGYGQLAADFIAAFAPVDDGTRLIVAPEGLSRFYVRRNPDRVGASWMTREDRTHEIADYVRYLDAVYDAVFAGRPPGTVHLLGFSQGAATASRWFTMGRARLDRLILWAGPAAHDLDLHTLRARLGEAPLLLVVGTRDEYVDAERLASEENRLRSHNIPYRLLTFDGPHRIDRTTLLRLASG
ncbi:esterase [Rhodocaloribacter litoris]|uniref:alpha/beta hydrolase n=1 Tax=Rhodocaloribacter litoris TaxID=2558931 RepID=UPI00142055C1|nr:dienelactone hydrolase family protein [Rhodocaloribacter litoris]QXD16833.1 esterase [Rhodocaloribacter litoris]GIV60526.1 MAG: esterase [Rhodothermaceae bacterium]